MAIIAFLKFILTATRMILIITFKLAEKLRLTFPLLYFLLTATFLNPWATRHETLAMGILLALVGLSLFSWIVTLKNKLGNHPARI